MNESEYQRLKRLNIRVFSTPTCKPCKDAKKFLDDHGVPYTAYDITTDEKAYQEMLRITGGIRKGVPLICFGDNDEHRVGYGQGVLNKLFGI